MSLYRCLNQNCSDGAEGAPPVFDFEGPVGAACPKCGATQKDNPHVVVVRATIHYLVNDDKGPIRTPNGRRRVACDPAASKMPKHATGTATAVSCPGCKASTVFAEHVADNVDQGQRIITGVPPQLAGGGVVAAE